MHWEQHSHKTLRDLSQCHECFTVFVSSNVEDYKKAICSLHRSFRQVKRQYRLNLEGCYYPQIYGTCGKGCSTSLTNDGELVSHIQENHTTRRPEQRLSPVWSRQHQPLERVLTMKGIQDTPLIPLMALAFRNSAIVVSVDFYIQLSFWLFTTNNGDWNWMDPVCVGTNRCLMVLLKLLQHKKRDKTSNNVTYTATAMLLMPWLCSVHAVPAV